MMKETYIDILDSGTYNTTRDEWLTRGAAAY